MAEPKTDVWLVDTQQSGLHSMTLEEVAEDLDRTMKLYQMMGYDLLNQPPEFRQQTPLFDPFYLR